MDKLLYYRQFKSLDLSRHYAVADAIEHLTVFAEMCEDGGVLYDGRDMLDTINELINNINYYHAQINAVQKSISLIKEAEAKAEAKAEAE